jgi:hypothetical protein
MNKEFIEKLRYPVGRFTIPELCPEDVINQAILSIEQFPNQLHQLVTQLAPSTFTHRY